MVKRIGKRDINIIDDEEAKLDHEFCPRCEANLTLQRGYDNTLPYWICLGCGEMLINPAIDTDTNIVWLCDECGAMLNIQAEFSEDCREWTCMDCGHRNEINAKELYSSEDEYQVDLRSPYRGLSDEAILKLTEYQDMELIGDKQNAMLVIHKETGIKYVKKLLYYYDKSVYDYIYFNPIAHMPRINAMYEGSNCLIIIEEYIDGKTVDELIDAGPLSEKQVVNIAIKVCQILSDLHSCPTPIIHRDIKTSNIIIASDGEIYLLDMNVAKWFDPNKTEDTQFLGTQNYAAPEQIGYGMSASTTKTDVYALGMLINVMLTCAFPKEKKADGRMWDVIEHCICLEADKRYSVEELMEELEKIERAL